MNIKFTCRIRNRSAILPHTTTTTEYILGSVVIAAFALLTAHIAVGFFLP